MNDTLASAFPLHAVVDGLQEAVSAFRSVRDGHGAIVDFEWAYANHAAAGTVGYPRDELIGHTMLELLPGHGPSGMLDVYRRVVETGEPFEHPAQWFEDTWGDGTRKRRAFDVRATKSEDGFVLLTRDVTEELIVSELRELALAQERSVTQQLRELDEARAALIAAVTHDLRTPLAGIVGLSRLLEIDWDDMAEATRREYVHDIVRSGEDLDRRITSILEHLKLETGRYEVEPEVCNVGDELAGALDRMSLMLDTYRVVFDVPEEAHVWADRIALARVVENLLSNAVKYAPPETTVTLRAHREGNAIVVSVIDEGPGVSQEDAQRVFKQFERLESGRRVAHGNGVGLSAVRQLVELMEGRVWVEPNETRGSAFRFALPAA